MAECIFIYVFGWKMSSDKDMAFSGEKRFAHVVPFA